MQTTDHRILLIELATGVTPPPDRSLNASSFGALSLRHCSSLAEAGGVLGADPFDGVLIDLDARDCAQLAAWTGLAQAAPDKAVVVLVSSGELDTEIATQFVQAGVQDVLDGAAYASRDAALGDAARSLRLSIERKRIERDARRTSATDLRTGLPDRQQLIDHMSQLLALRGREPAPMSLLVLRVEGFDTIEGAHGSETANVLRRKVGVRLRAAVRASDVVAALTADTYALLLASTEEPLDAERVAEKLRKALQAPFAVAGQDLGVAASVGISRFPGDGDDAAVLMRQALAAAAAAGVAGRDGFANWRESGWRDLGAANDG